MKISLILVIISSFFLAACSNSLDCSSDEAKQLIGDLTKENELLTKGWQLTALGKAGEIEAKMRSQAKSELENLQNSQRNSEKNIASLAIECKTSLKQSDTLKIIENENNTISSKFGEIERYTPVQPPRFFWKAGSTQQEHDNWALAEKKYQDELQNKRMTLQSLNANKINNFRTIEVTQKFIDETCQNTVKHIQSEGSPIIRVLSPSDIEEIVTRTHRYNPGRIPNQSIKDLQFFVETKIAPEVAILSTAVDKVNNFSKNLDSEISTAREKEIAKFKSDLDNAKYVLENIITTSKNESTGALVCKAEIKSTINESTNVKGNVVYTLEKTADKKLYATIKSIN